MLNIRTRRCLLGVLSIAYLTFGHGSIVHAEQEWQLVANHKFPAVVSSLDIPTHIVNNKTYDFSWNLAGYLNEYDSVLRFIVGNNSKHITGIRGTVSTDQSMWYNGDIPSSYIKQHRFAANNPIFFDSVDELTRSVRPEPVIATTRFYKRSQNDTFITDEDDRLTYGSALIPGKNSYNLNYGDTIGRELNIAILPNHGDFTGEKHIDYDSDQGLSLTQNYNVRFIWNNVDPERGIIDFTFYIENYSEGLLKEAFFVALIPAEDDFLELPGVNRGFGIGSYVPDTWKDVPAASENPKLQRMVESGKGLVGSVAGAVPLLGDGLSAVEIADSVRSSLGFVGDLFSLDYLFSGRTDDQIATDPTDEFTQDAANDTHYKAFRFILPDGGSGTAGTKYLFTFRIRHHWVNKDMLATMPRFYFSAVNTLGTNERATLQIGTRDTRTFSAYLTDYKFGRDKFIFFD